MPQYLELTEDEMVEKLQILQKLARTTFKTGQSIPYDNRRHEKACGALIVEMHKLAKEGDIV